MPRAKKHPHNRFESEQDVRTPSLFLDAVEERFGEIALDLAAKLEDRVVYRHISPDSDSLSSFSWTRALGGGLGWLNPPFSRIRPWAQKCRREAAEGAKIALLTPAGISTRWFDEEIACRKGAAIVLGVRPKLIFQGFDKSFTKDLILSYFDDRLRRTGKLFEVWNWTKLRGAEMAAAEFESRARRAKRITEIAAFTHPYP